MEYVAELIYNNVTVLVTKNRSLFEWELRVNDVPADGWDSNEKTIEDAIREGKYAIMDWLQEEDVKINYDDIDVVFNNQGDAIFEWIGDDKVVVYRGPSYYAPQQEWSSGMYQYITYWYTDDDGPDWIDSDIIEDWRDNE